MRRAMSVWLPNWPITRWKRSPRAIVLPEPDPDPRDWEYVPKEPPPEPVGMVLAGLQDGARRVTAVDELAAREGAFAGQSLADALTLLPGLKIVDADPEEDEAALTRLADWCARFSPSVAVDPSDGLLIDITGCAHLWGGEPAMADALLQRLAAQDIPARIGIAGTFGAAWALARYAPPPVTLARSGDELTCLAALTVAGLRLDESQVRQLRRLGLKTIGQAAALPRVALRKRFGDSLLRQLAFALGERNEALRFRQPVSPWRDYRVFADPIGKPEDMPALLHTLAEALCSRLERAGLGARWFELALHRVDGDIAKRSVGTALPARDVKRLTDLFAPKLETVDPGFGIEVAILTAETVQALLPSQTSLVDSEEEARQADLAPLIDRLRNRFGMDRVWQVTPYPSHVPERAVARVAPFSPTANADPFIARHRRSVRLFRWAEPIVPSHALLPDYPPRSFTWRGKTHGVRRAEGPERIAAEWWRRPWAENADDRIRDYYQIEDQDGARFWIFRTGLQDGPREVQWWLHGFFA